MITELNNLITDIIISNLKFYLSNKLLYYIKSDKKDIERLCILNSIKKEIFKQAYNHYSYIEFYQTYNKLYKLIYIQQMIKRLQTYIKYYLVY